MNGSKGTGSSWLQTSDMSTLMSANSDMNTLKSAKSTQTDYRRIDARANIIIDRESPCVVISINKIVSLPIKESNQNNRCSLGLFQKGRRWSTSI